MNSKRAKALRRQDPTRPHPGRKHGGYEAVVVIPDDEGISNIRSVNKDAARRIAEAMFSTRE